MSSVATPSASRPGLAHAPARSWRQRHAPPVTAASSSATCDPKKWLTSARRWQSLQLRCSPPGSRRARAPHGAEMPATTYRRCCQLRPADRPGRVLRTPRSTVRTLRNVPTRWTKSKARTDNGRTCVLVALSASTAPGCRSDTVRCRGESWRRRHRRARGHEIVGERLRAEVEHASQVATATRQARVDRSAIFIHGLATVMASPRQVQRRAAARRHGPRP